MKKYNDMTYARRAVHSGNPDIHDTYEYFGKQECVVAELKSQQIDETNLTSCERLLIAYSSIDYLGSGNLGNLSELTVRVSDLPSLLTAQLVGLRVLRLWYCRIATLDTRWLGALQTLELSGTGIAHVDLRLLKGLCELQIVGGVAAVDLHNCVRLRSLYLESRRLGRIAIPKGLALEELVISQSAIRFLDLRGMKRMRCTGRMANQLLCAEGLEM